MICLCVEDFRDHAVPADRLISFMLKVIRLGIHSFLVAHHLRMITHQWDTTLLVQTAVTLGEAELGEWCRDSAHGLGSAAMGPCTELTATTRAR